MPFESVLRVRAGDRPFTLIVEPWANEFPIAADEQCRVVARHPTAPPTFEVEPGSAGDLIVYVNESRSTFEFWRGSVREFWTPVPIPG
ncbi:MAG TPA: hypothetical protein VKD90_02585 [Gemmataceae bacterium]|nr:hypothetical protein [Gemmataceae bacterium]